MTPGLIFADRRLGGRAKSSVFGTPDQVSARGTIALRWRAKGDSEARKGVLKIAV